MDIDVQHTTLLSQEDLDENFDLDIRIALIPDEHDESFTITDIDTHSLDCL